MKRTIELPCDIGDTVYLYEIDKTGKNGEPHHKAIAGRVFAIQIDKSIPDTEIWLRVEFGLLHCCRKYTDFYLSKEEADREIKRLNTYYYKYND